LSWELLIEQKQEIAPVAIAGAAVGTAAGSTVAATTERPLKPAVCRTNDREGGLAGQGRGRGRPGMSSDRVRVDVAAGVADVRLNRPDKLNALDVAMFDAVIAAGEAVAADPAVRAVVLSGAGRGFCAGLDLGLLGDLLSAGAAGVTGAAVPGAGGGASDLFRREAPGRLTNRAQHASRVWLEMEPPVIAAIHGPALGGGLQLALGADIRLVAADARLAVAEIRWGLVPDMTGSQMLPRLVGADVAKELTWTGRTVTGTEAVAIGLATRVSVDPRAEALELAALIAGQSPDAVQGAKKLIDLATTATLAEAFLAEERTMRRLLGSPNQLEAVEAGLAGRRPHYVDPDRHQYD
jgi:enoyl-CoA hydratase/carnithine racemase